MRWIIVINSRPNLAHGVTAFMGTGKTINTSQLTTHRNQSGPEKGQSGQEEILARRAVFPIRKAA